MFLGSPASHGWINKRYLPFGFPFPNLVELVVHEVLMPAKLLFMLINNGVIVVVNVANAIHWER